MSSHLVFAFSILGNIAAAFVYLAPAPIFIRIYRRKSTEENQPIPYVIALFSFIMWLYYGWLNLNLAIISTNAIGCVIEMVYIVMYLYYALRPNQISTARLLGLFIGLFFVIFAVTLPIIEGQMIIAIVGWIWIISTVMAFESPLFIVYQVIRDRSVKYMPVTLSCSLTLSGGVWFTYGLLTGDLVVEIPNVIGFLLGIFQIVIYMVFRNAKPNAHG